MRRDYLLCGFAAEVSQRLADRVGCRGENSDGITPIVHFTRSGIEIVIILRKGGAASPLCALFDRSIFTVGFLSSVDLAGCM